MYNIIFHIVLITLTHQTEGYIIKVNKSKVLKYGVDSILQKYLNPIRRLSEDLPNHQVEVQLDLVGSFQQTPVNDVKRHHRPYQQPKIRRAYTDLPNTSSTPKSPTTFPTSQSTTTTSTTTNVITTLPTVTDFGRQPVYMDDLQKALEDFEKRFTTTEPASTTSCNGHQTSSTPIQRPRHPSGPVYPVDRSIFGLIKLLRQGVQVDSPVPNPTNENLEWLQVKVPKPVA